MNTHLFFCSIILLSSFFAHSQKPPFRYVKRNLPAWSLVDPSRFRIVTWNGGNSRPDCAVFKQLMLFSVAKRSELDLVVFG